MKKHLNEKEKLKRELFIPKNINACCSSTIKDKEIAVKDFTTLTLPTFYKVLAISR